MIDSQFMKTGIVGSGGLWAYGLNGLSPFVPRLSVSNVLIILSGRLNFTVAGTDKANARGIRLIGIL